MILRRPERVVVGRSAEKNGIPDVCREQCSSSPCSTHSHDTPNRFEVIAPMDTDNVRQQLEWKSSNWGNERSEMQEALFVFLDLSIQPREFRLESTVLDVEQLAGVYAL